MSAPVVGGTGGQGGFCSLECGAKVVAWLQTITTGAVILFWLSVLVVVGMTSPEEGKPIPDELQLNITEEEVKERQQAAKTLAIIFLVMILIYYVVVWILSVLLLIGIYKYRMKYVTGWLVAKGILLALAGAAIVLRIFAMLLGMDSDLTWTIIWFVLDSLQVFVVYNFWSEKKSEFIPI